MIRLLALLLALLQAPAVRNDSVPPPEGAVVQLSGDSLFSLYWSTSAYTAADRAKRISNALEHISDRGFTASDSFTIVEEANRTEIRFGGAPLFFLADADAVPTGMTRAEAAKRYVATLRIALMSDAPLRKPGAIWRDAGEAALATVLLVVTILLLNLAFRRLYSALEGSRGRLSVAMRRIGLEGTSEDASSLLVTLAHYLRALVILLVVVVYVPLTLRLFPQTAGIASPFIAAIKSPVVTAMRALVEYLPNVVFIALIVFGTRILLRLVRAFFLAVERGQVRLRRFDAEWAIPTYEIVRPLILALALVLIFPYLPGSESEAIKGVSIFVGILLSFGSSSAIANVIAGVVLLYSRAFRVGDWVRVGTAEGKVITRTLLMTRLRTPKNVEISVPSSVMLATPIENFTEKARSGTLILHSTVTIGYDAPWRKVHELLIAAALDTMHILREPAPFVLQEALGDFNVSYQINVFTDTPDEQPAIYGDLHRNIQEQFNAAGVEIMSPNYYAVRDGNTVTTPAGQRPEGYRAPSFRVDVKPE